MSRLVKIGADISIIVSEFIEIVEFTGPADRYDRDVAGLNHVPPRLMLRSYDLFAEDVWRLKISIFP